MRYAALARGKIHSCRGQRNAEARTLEFREVLVAARGFRKASGCGLNASFTRPLRENVSNRLPRVVEVRPGGKLEDFRAIEWVFDTDRLRRGRARGYNWHSQ